jgi:hypothetical protein
VGQKLLAMNFTNPNLLGIWLLQFVLYSLIAVFVVKSKFVRIALVVEVIALSYLTYLTGSRTAFMCIPLFMTMLIFQKAFLGSRKDCIHKWIIILVVLLPLVVAIAYSNLIDTFSILFSDFSSEGKSIMSRYSIWQDALYFFKLNILTGSYYEAGNGTGAFQLHNTHLDLLSSYGIIVFSLVMYYVYVIIERINRDVRNKTQTLCIIGFFITWFMGTGEAALFSGGQGIYIVQCSFLLVARCGFQKPLITKNTIGEK